MQSFANGVGGRPGEVGWGWLVDVMYFTETMPLLCPVFVVDLLPPPLLGV